MGSNLALNIEEHGFAVAVWNHSPERVDSFMSENAGKNFTPAKTLEAFVGALKRPRKMLMMIKAGAPVDETIEKLRPLLEPGDIIIDGGNSYFKDTQRREAYLRGHNINFIGTGVSGGEEGARHGPSIMPGGAGMAYEQVRPIFEAIAAKTDSGACVTYVGPDGAGHFVKMVHNGIEYGDMQLIAETYDILRSVAGLMPDEMAEVFAEWNRGLLESFLIEITANILRVKDEETGRPLVDLVLDKAAQKGTGKWTAEEALDLGVVIPTIAAAIDARVLSSMKAERVEASRVISGPRASEPHASELSGDKDEFVAALRDALYASKICSYAQGLNLIRKASDQYNWNVDLAETARIWKGGCIIRARFLDSIMSAYTRRKDLPNLLLDTEFNAWMQTAQSSWRRVIQEAVAAGIPVPAMSASLSYFDSYRTASLPQNLTQAQRDYFGAHTYERIDQPERGNLHTEWADLSK